jgi:hypothetical protein
MTATVKKKAPTLEDQVAGLLDQYGLRFLETVWSEIDARLDEKAERERPRLDNGSLPAPVMKLHWQARGHGPCMCATWRFACGGK